MTIYILIGSIIGVLAVIQTFTKVETKNNDLLETFFYIIISLFAFVFVGFRECGFDFESYNNLYESFTSDDWALSAVFYRIEFGYAYLNHILWSYRSVLIIMAFFTIGLQFRFVYRFSPLPFLSLFMLLGVILYPMIMGQFRQALAISIVLWALVYREHKALFLLLIILAALFHSTAVIGLFVLFLPDKLFKTKFYLIALLIALASNFTMRTFLVSASNLLPSIMSEKIDIYSSAEDFVLGLNVAMLLRIIVFTLFVLNKDIFESFSKGSYFMNIYFLSLLVYLGIGFLPQIAVRGSLYFYSLEFILASMLIIKSNVKLKIFFLIFFVSISIYRQIGFFTEWKDDYIPYQNELFIF